ncbi:hypothetical protein SAMN04488023_11652 [Pedobacter rhizosphaerae]|uniref:Uncharacterized protein n=1 Tax=Pedobacter rhizosphaerae TaxID=390241 RepID=A0A1H9S0I6_9SPHI|nr:hypothetical protein SAMN04488023_11652 [Pedobacter rhizosphaerae]
MEDGLNSDCKVYRPFSHQHIFHLFYDVKGKYGNEL